MLSGKRPLNSDAAIAQGVKKLLDKFSDPDTKALRSASRAAVNDIGIKYSPPGTSSSTPPESQIIQDYDPTLNNDGLNKVYFIGIGDGLHTYSIAASNSDEIAQVRADLICDGTNDEEEINSAIALMVANGGRIVLSSGDFYLDSQIIIANDNIWLDGSGADVTNLHVDGTKTIWDNAANSVIDVTSSGIKGTRLSNFEVTITGDPTGLIAGKAIINVGERSEIENIHITAAIEAPFTYGIYLDPNTLAPEMEVRNCRIVGGDELAANYTVSLKNLAYGVYVPANALFGSQLITSTTIVACQYGIIINDDHSIVSGNILYGISNTGIEVGDLSIVNANLIHDSPLCPSPIVADGYGITISSNVMSEVGKTTGGSIPELNGILVRSNNCVITGNIIGGPNDSTGNGITLGSYGAAGDVNSLITHTVVTGNSLFELKNGFLINNDFTSPTYDTLIVGNIVSETINGVELNLAIFDLSVLSNHFNVLTAVVDNTTTLSNFDEDITISRFIGSGTAFPTTDLEDGMLFNRTDLGIMYRYDLPNTAWIPIDFVAESSRIADGLITKIKFAVNIEPIQIVSSLPLSGMSTGEVVFLTTDSKLYRYDGAAWTTKIDGVDIVDGSIVASDKLVANSIKAGQIEAGAITATELSSINIGVGKYIQSLVYSAKVTGWSINSDGTAEFNNVTVRGDIISGNWNGLDPADLSVVDTTATAGFYLDSSVGSAQFEGSVFVGGDLILYEGGKFSIGDTAGTRSEVVVQSSISSSVKTGYYVHNGTSVVHGGDMEVYYAPGFGHTFKWTIFPDLSIKGGMTLEMGGADDITLTLFGNTNTWFVGNYFRGSLGGATTPTYGFSSDGDTGMYRSGTNQLSWSGGGVELMRLSSAGNLSIAGQYLYFDTIAGNDYIHIPEASNYARIVLDGAERWRVDTAGDMRISGDQLMFAGSTTDYIQMPDASNYFRVVLDGTERWRTNTSGQSLAGSYGTATLPTHSWLGDPDTGMYHDTSSGVISWAYNGTRKMTQSGSGLSVTNYGVPNTPVDAFTSKSSSTTVAGRFYRISSASNNQVLQVRSNVGGTEITKWYVDTDGDAVKSSDPAMKSYIKPARSYWDDYLDLDKSDAIIQHRWKKSKDKKVLTNWNAEKVKDVFPKLVTTTGASDDTEHMMVNYSALDIIAHKVLMEAQKRIEQLESQVATLIGAG